MSILAGAGHDATSVFSQNLQGSPDSRIIEVCLAENRSLVTQDLDFADIRSYPPADYPGPAVLRLTRQDKYSLIEALQRVLPSLESETLRGRLWIIEEQRIRIRGGKLLSNARNWLDIL